MHAYTHAHTYTHTHIHTQGFLGQDSFDYLVSSKLLYLSYCQFGFFLPTQDKSSSVYLLGLFCSFGNTLRQAQAYSIQFTDVTT